MDPEVPRSSRGGGTIPSFLPIIMAVDPVSGQRLLRNENFLFQRICLAVVDENTIVLCDNCVPIGALGESRGCCPVGQGNFARKGDVRTWL